MAESTPKSILAARYLTFPKQEEMTRSHPLVRAVRG